MFLRIRRLENQMYGPNGNRDEPLCFFKCSQRKDEKKEGQSECAQGLLLNHGFGFDDEIFDDGGRKCTNFQYLI